jgi:hypothetical protein
LKAVEPLYGTSDAVFGIHFYQRDSPALPGIPASDDRNRGDLSSRGKMLIQFSLTVSFDKLLRYNFDFTFDPWRCHHPISVKLLKLLKGRCRTAEKNQNRMKIKRGRGTPRR